MGESRAEADAAEDGREHDEGARRDHLLQRRVGRDLDAHAYRRVRGLQDQLGDPGETSKSINSNGKRKA